MLLPFLLLTGALAGNILSIASLSLSSPPSIAESLPVPLGLPPVPWPADNPYSAKKAELGRLLFFDPRLSSDGTISCASCHSPTRGFAEHKPLSEGILGRKGDRNSPTIINSAYLKHLFWDGRASSLEEQCKGPISNTKEMALVDDIHGAERQCQERIRSIAGYRALFREVFGQDDCSVDEIAKAIATFERTILSGNAPYDRYRAGDSAALTPQQLHGYEVFQRVGCSDCHVPPTFLGGGFANIGIGMESPDPDLGRYRVVPEAWAWGAFKIPTLRDVASTAPYMHDGCLLTLDEVIDFYDKGGRQNPNLDKHVVPLNLSQEEKASLKSFLLALSGEGWHHVVPPEKLPE